MEGLHWAARRATVGHTRWCAQGGLSRSRAHYPHDSLVREIGDSMPWLCPGATPCDVLRECVEVAEYFVQRFRVVCTMRGCFWLAG